jgi:hypothetical protein
LLCYFFALAGRLVVSKKFSEWQRWLRAVWTLGLLLLLAHIAAVFHFVHGWRHELAVEHTARATRAVVGQEFGWGVYFNYVFAALWSADVAWWWFAPASRQDRNKAYTILLHSYLLFIVINSLIVFETGVLRWSGMVGLVVLILVSIRRLTLRSDQSSARVEAECDK